VHQVKSCFYLKKNVYFFQKLIRFLYLDSLRCLLEKEARLNAKKKEAKTDDGVEDIADTSENT
jgi:hypothetical protein